MERYNEYKDSGVYFIPDIPNSWQVLKAKYLFKQEKREVRPEDEIVTCFRDGQVTLRKNRRTEGFTNSMKEIGYQGVRKGDLVIHNMDAFAGAIGVSDSDGKGTPVYACCTPKRNDINQYYYCYLLRYLARNGFILSLAKGIRERSTDFRFNDFKELYLPVPSKEEQDAIVSYIDLQSTKIDEAIAQQQKMIDLLNERKQIIINNAVTKGLNPDAPMKDSGVDWIGEIPEHWEALRIRYIGEAKNGLTYSPNDMVDEGNGILVLRSSNIQDGKLAFEDNVYVKGAPEKLWVKKGDIIICSRNGSASLVGKCAIVEEDIYASFGAFMMRFRSEHNSKYTYYLLTAAISHYKQLFATSTINQLTLGIFADIKMPFVYDLQEQTKIAESLDLAIKKLDTAISNATKQISLLQERKQIIINDVVTGKVKVC